MLDRTSKWPWMALAVCLLAALLGGCATPAGELFPALAQPVVWPGGVEQARIRYVGQLATSVDLKPARSGLENVGEALFGKDDAHSLLTPFAVCVDNTGDRDRLIVADSNAQCVHVFDLHTRKYEKWAPPPKQPQFGQPVGIALDPGSGKNDQRVLVADSVAGALIVFDGRGKYLGQIGQGRLKRPVGVAVDRATRRIFVADAGLHNVVVFSAAGDVIMVLGHRGTRLGEFNFPTNVTLDHQGRLYVSDSLNFRVQQFDADLKPLRQIGGKGDMPGYFAQPRSIAVDSQDHLYVVDPQFESVQIFDDQGQLLLDFGEEGGGPGQFWLPAGMAIDGQDRIWVADSYNRRVQVFQYLREKSP